MGAIKDFIKENSPPSQTPKQKKKRKRVRLKNFNPFRKRKYDVLKESNNTETDNCCPQHTALSVVGDDQHNSCPEPEQEQVNPSGSGTKHKSRPHQRARHREFLHAARGSLGQTKCKPGDPGSGKKWKARRHGAYECLVEEESPVGGDGGATPDAGSLSGSDGDGTPEEKAGSSAKRVAISDDIEVIETVEQAPPQKKKKSARKRIKKAGIRTAKYLGRGLANMAMNYQFMTPEAALVPVAKEMAQRREQQYRDMHISAYTMVT